MAAPTSTPANPWKELCCSARARRTQAHARRQGQVLPQPALNLRHRRAKVGPLVAPVTETTVRRLSVRVPSLPGPPAMPEVGQLHGVPWRDRDRQFADRAYARRPIGAQHRDAHGPGVRTADNRARVEAAHGWGGSPGQGIGGEPKAHRARVGCDHEVGAAHHDAALHVDHASNVTQQGCRVPGALSPSVCGPHQIPALRWVVARW